MFAFAWVVFIYYYSTHAVTTPAPTDIHKHARTHAHTRWDVCFAWHGVAAVCCLLAPATGGRRGCMMKLLPRPALLSPPRTTHSV